MMPRKKRITLIVIFIILIVILVLGTLTFLYLKTDAFKSNEVLFTKYFSQNFDILEIIKNEDTLEIEDTLNTNKYTSELIGKIQYTENIGTSAENKNNPINNVGIKINSNIDRINNYDYRDIDIGTDEENLLGLEYLKENESYAIRLNGIKQFVSLSSNLNNEELQNLQLEDIEKITSEIDINSILNFTQQEKETLTNTYIGIVQSNVTKDKYYKQLNSIITIDNQKIQTNAYYIKLTIEEYNNLYIKILEQITRDEIILSKIDLIENEIKDRYPDYEQEESLRDIFINNINDKIEEIQNNNIGNEEVKITVYENNRKTVRTSIENSNNKIVIDLYNNSSIKIDNITTGENINEEIIKIEKSNNEIQSNILLEFQKVQDSEITNDIKISYNKMKQNNQISKDMEVQIDNGKYQAVLNIENDIQLVEKFENQITLDNDNVKLEEYEQEQVNSIINILAENIQKQLNNLFSTVSLEDYIQMLGNIEIVKQNIVPMPNEEVTDIERKRFNSQFEFFVSENLTADNVKELMQIVKENLDDMKVLLKTGEIEDLNMELLKSQGQEATQYKDSISEILISISRNSKNEDKQNDILEFLEVDKNNKYTISIEYNDEGLVRIIRIKIQED